MAAKKMGHVTVEWNLPALGNVYRSMAMARILEEKGRILAEEKTAKAAAHLQGQMPKSGLFGYHLRLGRKTWILVIRPNNKAAYAIGNKHPVKRL